MDTKTVDLQREGRTFDPWQLWREYIDRIEALCARENRGMSDAELEKVNALYFAAMQMEVMNDNRR
jgi:hypothetical protein